MIQATLLKNKSGFTLVEVLVAFVILVIGLMGLLTSVNIALVENMKTAVRDEVTRIASGTMQDMRAESFDAVVTTTTPTVVQSRLRSMNIQYSVRRTVVNLDSISKQYQVDVSWTYKGQPMTHSIAGIRSKTD